MTSVPNRSPLSTPGRSYTRTRRALALADTTLFSELKEPRANLEEGELAHLSLAHFARSRLARRMPLEAARRIVAFSNRHCRCHEDSARWQGSART